MAVVNPPGWLQNAGATHTASQMRSYLGGMMGPARAALSLVPAGGVNQHLGNKLQVTQTGSPTMAIIVKSGIAWLPGTENGTQGPYGAMNDADLTISVTAAHATLPRIDIVVFKVEDSQYSGAVDTASLVVVAGTPAGSPTAPAVPANGLKLADIAVAAAAASITNANITDQRTYLGTASGIILPDVQVFTAGGSWNKPTGARFVHVQVQGSGGAGGGGAAASAGQHSKGCGGGGGGYAESILDASVLAATVTVTVGAGGAGVSGGAGNAGNTSSFGASVVAAGGSGGATSTGSAASYGTAGAAGGIGTTGQILTRGGAGGNAYGDVQLSTGGPGGSSHMGGGGIGTATVSAGQSIAGGTGGVYGGGGGGGSVAGTGAAATGGTGGGGLVIVTTYF